MTGSSKVICVQDGRYIGWPTIAKTEAGELLVVFSGDRDAHVCPFGKTFLIRSSDAGETWSAPECINDSPVDDRDAGICIAPDGAAVVSWFASHYLDEWYLRQYETRHPEWMERLKARLADISEGDIRQWTGEGDMVHERYPLGRWTRRGPGAGSSWEAPVRAPVTTPHGPITLSDGRLLFFGIEGNDRREHKDNMAAAESTDNGKSWRVIGKVGAYPEYPGTAPDGTCYLCEPHVVEVAPGRILGMARCEVRPGEKRFDQIYQFESDDGGATWTTPRPTGIIGKPPHLTRLADGRILLTYGYRHKPFGQRARLSDDGGATWDAAGEIILRDDAPSGDLGYPASVELADGEIATVYYQQETAGAQTCLMLTKWRA